MTKGLAVMTLSFLLFVQSGFTQIQSILTFFFRLMPRFSPLEPPPFWIREFEFEFDEVVSIFVKKFVQNYVKTAWKVAKFWRNLICFCFEFCATPKSCGVTRLDLFGVSKNANVYKVHSKMVKIQRNSQSSDLPRLLFHFTNDGICKLSSLQPTKLRKAIKNKNNARNALFRIVVHR